LGWSNSACRVKIKHEIVSPNRQERFPLPLCGARKLAYDLVGVSFVDPLEYPAGHIIVASHACFGDLFLFSIHDVTGRSFDGCSHAYTCAEYIAILNTGSGPDGSEGQGSELSRVLDNLVKKGIGGGHRVARVNQMPKNGFIGVAWQAIYKYGVRAVGDICKVCLHYLP